MALTNSALIVPPPTPVTPAGTNDIRSLRPPVEIPSGWEWLWWTLGVAVAVVLLVLAIRWFIRWLNKGAATAAPIEPPHTRARRRLELALRHLSDPRQFCTEVSDALRAYLEERFQLRAPERTTEEFLQDLGRTEVLNAGQKSRLSEFLQQCDLVKFARFEPTEAALRELWDAALRLVDETAYDAVAPGTPTPPPTAPVTGADPAPSNLPEKPAQP